MQVFPSNFFLGALWSAFALDWYVVDELEREFLRGPLCGCGLFIVPFTTCSGCLVVFFHTGTAVKKQSSAETKFFVGA